LVAPVAPSITELVCTLEEASFAKDIFKMLMKQTKLKVLNLYSKPTVWRYYNSFDLFSITPFDEGTKSYGVEL